MYSHSLFVHKILVKVMWDITWYLGFENFVDRVRMRSVHMRFLHYCLHYGKALLFAMAVMLEVGVEVQRVNEEEIEHLAVKQGRRRSGRDER